MSFTLFPPPDPVAGFSLYAAGYQAYVSPWFSPLWGQVVNSGIFYDIKMVLVSLGIVLFLWLIYLVQKKNQMHQKMHSMHSPKIVAPAPKKLDPRTEKWNVVLEHINSSNQAEWRMAIIEADTYLEELMHQRGTPGETLGDMLKATKIKTVNDAWEAHKVRNQIAHKGSSFNLTKHEANRVVHLYERVFHEMGVL